ncbi:MFS transporter [Bowmanella sp. Y26]|uniref:MFS transporter n=1 Tax=Bowmanella yangjiangensis TaxID=2811230 RepID=UPI001BDC91B6|nr:MFS transporter [Bowmanella yangjiangensis]MBT1063729.1 MFS transporter [Bowmanella yangjiangensis]
MEQQKAAFDRGMMPIVMAGGIILALAFGVRSIFGGVVEPLSESLFDGRIEIFSISIAIQNLVWGIAQPAFGAIADKFGDRRALWIGFVCYVLGMLICASGSTPFAQHLGAGVLVGMGVSGTAFGIVLAVVGRASPENKRNHYLGITSAIGSVGQVVMPLLASWLTEWLDWRLMLVVITAALLPMLVCIPQLRVASNSHLLSGNSAEVPVSIAVKSAFGHNSYLLLNMGFFVCGFHLAFITAHLPNYVQYFCVSSATADELRALGLQALALAGFANIFGTLIATRLGSLFPKPYVLASIYALRAVVIVIFISQPVTPTSLMIFALIMGVLWLSTVPLTSALVLTMFGSRSMGTLFGFVFLSHQLGSFFGVWLGGASFDRYASYDQVWYLSIFLGLISAIAHLFVIEKPAPEVLEKTA